MNFVRQVPTVTSFENPFINVIHSSNHLKIMKARAVFYLLAMALIQFSCSKDNEAAQPEQDPLMGTWYLRALQVNGQTADVSNMACYKDTRFQVDEKMFTLTVSVTQSQTSTSCATQSQSAEWENANGTYYMTMNGQRQNAGIQLNDNNETLQMTITVDGEPAILVFRK